MYTPTPTPIHPTTHTHTLVPVGLAAVMKSALSHSATPVTSQTMTMNYQVIVVLNVRTIPPATNAPNVGLNVSGGLTSVPMDRWVRKLLFNCVITCAVFIQAFFFIIVATSLICLLILTFF